MNNEEQRTIQVIVRRRVDYQGMRKRIDNCMGLKADGQTPQQNIIERAFLPEDKKLLEEVRQNAHKYEQMLEKALLERLRRLPIYTEYLSKIVGVGPVAAGWIVAEFDIHKATTVSKMWQFAGLNPGMVRGKKRHELGGGKWRLEITDTLIAGDRLTPDFVAPFNQKLRTALVGVLADGFIKAQAPYALDYYYPYKARLEQEENKIAGREKAWSEVSKGHRDRAAKRYMIKAFLRDLYVAWRTLEGLPVRAPYAEEYLGKQHEE